MVLNLLQNKRYIFLKLSDMEYINQPRKVLDKTEWISIADIWTDERYNDRDNEGNRRWFAFSKQSAKDKGLI